MSDTIYCYPDSDVLINKMDIRDQAKLEEAERRLTMFRMSDLLDVPVKGDFDLDHLKSIHRYLFQDLYSWAGEIRTVDIIFPKSMPCTRFGKAMEGHRENSSGSLR